MAAYTKKVAKVARLLPPIFKPTNQNKMKHDIKDIIHKYYANIKLTEIENDIWHYWPMWRNVGASSEHELIRQIRESNNK